MSTNTLFWGKTKQVSFRVDGFSKGWAGLSAAGSRHSSILSKSPTSDISAATAAVLHAGDAAVAVLHAGDAAVAVLHAWDAAVAVLHAWDAAVAALHAEDAVVAVLQAGDAVMAITTSYYSYW